MQNVQNISVHINTSFNLSRLRNILIAYLFRAPKSISAVLIETLLSTGLHMEHSGSNPLLKTLDSPTSGLTVKPRRVQRGEVTAWLYYAVTGATIVHR